ncbi:MAG: biopolymer transporter ExbD [Thiotrichales bacterium]|nr:MAG: biopolymer transporter ExbD [Thiotrichales bacterium]
MARRHHYRRYTQETPELNITTFLNLMVVLVPFLLITAVFSRITILELNLPTGAGDASKVNKPSMSVEVIVREKGLEIGNGKTILVRFPKQEDQYDLQTMSEYLLKIKAKYLGKKDATVLMEPDIEYENLVAVMDAVRIAEVVQGDDPEPQEIELFPNISIGDAP